MRYFRLLFAIFIIFALAIVGVMYILANSANIGFDALTKEEHNDLYNNEQNGWHEIETALASIQVPTKAVQEELSAFTIGTELSPEAIAFLDAQQEAIALAHSGLEHDYLIQKRYDINVSRNPNLDSQLRALARVLVWDGHRSASNDQYPEATERYIDAIELGHWNANGGVLIDALVSTAIQRIGLEALQKILPELDDATLESVIVDLEHLEATSIHFGTIMATERDVMREQPGNNVVTRVVGNFTNRTAYEGAEESYNRGRAMLIGTRLRAQVLLHEKQTGAPPAILAEVLAPNPVPIDPTTGNPFQLTPEGKITSPGERPGGEALEF